MLEYKRIFLITCLLLSFSYSKSQDFTINRIPCENVEYLISFHFIKNINIMPSFSLSVPEFINFKDSLNKLFKPACIQFKICKIDTVLDYNYFLTQNEDRTKEYEDLVALHYDDHAINIYWVGDYQYETKNGICEPLINKPHIFIPYQTANYNNTNFFLRQVLDFFGMPVTESTPISIEFVNKTNGSITADSIWDTPADPRLLVGLNDTLYLPPSLGYMYTSIKDPNGDYYDPMIYNLLCDLPTPYKIPALTHGQYQRLVTNERMCRKKRW